MTDCRVDNNRDICDMCVGRFVENDKMMIYS